MTGQRKGFLPAGSSGRQVSDRERAKGRKVVTPQEGTTQAGGHMWGGVGEEKRYKYRITSLFRFLKIV